MRRRPDERPPPGGPGRAASPTLHRFVASPIVLAFLLITVPGAAPIFAADPPPAHAGTAEDPIPIRLGQRVRFEAAGPSPDLSVGAPAGEWLETMIAPFPCPGTVIFALEPESDGPVAIEVHSLDFFTGLRLSRVMPEGDVVPIALDTWDPSYYVWEDSELRPWLQAGVSYRVEVFNWSDEPDLSGEFEVAVREPGPDLWKVQWEERSGLGSGLPLWRHRIAYLKRLAERAESRGRHASQADALYEIGRQMAGAIDYPGLNRWPVEAPEFGLEDALGFMERAMALQREHRLPTGPVEPFYNVHYHILRLLGWVEEAERLIEQLREMRASQPEVDAEAEARARGDDRRLWAALQRRHGTLIEQGKPGEAEAVETELMEAARRVELGGEGLVAHTLAVQAGGVEARGDTKRASALREQARAMIAERWERLEASVSRAAGKPGRLMVLLQRQRGAGRGMLPALRVTDEDASKLFERSLRLAKEVLSGDDAWFSGLHYMNGMLDFLGPQYLAQERWDEVAPVVDRMIEVIEKVHGPESPRTIHTLTARWGVHAFAGGDAQKATQVLERAVIWFRSELGPNYFEETPYWVHWLGASYSWSGRLAEAKELLGWASHKTRLQSGNQLLPLDYRLIDVLTDLGDYEAARSDAEKAIAAGLDPGTAEGRMSNAVGKVMSMVGEHEEAIRILEEVVEHYRLPARQLGKKSVGLSGYHSSSLYRLVRALVAAGDLEKAQKALEELKDHNARARTGPSVRYIRVIEAHLEAIIQWGLGHDERAAGAAERAFEAMRQVEASRGGGRWYFTGLKALRAAILAREGSPEAMTAALEAQRDHYEFTRRTIPILSEARALHFAASGDKPWEESGIRPMGVVLSLLARGGGPEDSSIEAALDAVVHARSQVLDEVGARNRALAQVESNPELASLQASYQETARRAAYLLVRAATSEPDDKGRRILDDAMSEREQAEKALVEASVAFRRRRADEAVGVRDVRESLPPGSALVSYQVYEHMDLGHREGSSVSAPPPANLPSHVAAFVMRPGSAPPEFVDLGPAKAIEEAVSAWREALASDEAALRGMGAVATARPSGGEGRPMAFREAGVALRKLAWDPVATRLSGADRVFIVPDGALNLVSFAALPDGDGWLVESGPVIHYLSAERDLVGAPRDESEPRSPDDVARPTTSQTLLALGGIDYDATTMFASLGAAEPGTATALVAAKVPGAGAAGSAPDPSMNAFRGERSECGAFGSRRFEPLDATRSETSDITAIWESGSSSSRGGGGTSAPLTVTALGGADATETEFKKRAPGASIVHLATHGFFLGGECVSALDDTRGLGAVVTAENPLVLSGLALAGANNRRHAGENEDDGILTAQEIAAMDLTSVEWAVLSACETGVGEVRAGEGVFGLRRAFQVAGADTLIMSLWSVEDEATRAWMKALYEGRLVEGLDTAEAVRHASLAVLNDRREKGLSDHPFYWAAFVAAGQWR